MALLDEDDLRSVVDAHRDVLLAYATRLTGDRWLAEDAVQEALTRLWLRPEVLTNKQWPVESWLFTVVRNVLVDWARARAVRPLVTADFCDAVQDDHADDVLRSLTITSMLNGLRPQHREVLEHVYLRGLSVCQAALALNIPEGTAKSRLHKALRTLRGGDLAA